MSAMSERARAIDELIVDMPPAEIKAFAERLAGEVGYVLVESTADSELLSIANAALEGEGNMIRPTFAAGERFQRTFTPTIVRSLILRVVAGERGRDAAREELREAREIAGIFAVHWPYGRSAAGDEKLRTALCSVKPPAVQPQASR